MNLPSHIVKGWSVIGPSIERRSKPRITCCWLAVVRSVDACGERFEDHTVLDNLSATGLYVRLARPIACGAPLFVVVSFAHASCNTTTLRIAMRGVVVRAELHSDGNYGLAVAFTHHRFLYAATTGSLNA
jgi:hypothetical protein